MLERMIFSMPGSAVKAAARKLIFDNAPGLFFVCILYIVLITAATWFPFRLPGRISAQDIYSRLASGQLPGLSIIYTDFKLSGVFPAILLILLHPVLNTGFKRFCLKVARNKKAGLGDILHCFLCMLKVISIFIITSVLVFLWSLLLIVPGIVAGYRYRQAYYIFLDDPGKGVLQCITESKFLMYGRKLDLFTIDISFVGWFIALAALLMSPYPLVIPVIMIWLSPYVGLTRAAFYENILSGTAV